MTSRVSLADGSSTTIHLTSYNRKRVVPQLVVFDKSQSLIIYCQQKNITEAVSGGFFLSSQDTLLGEAWSHGTEHNYVPFDSPWNKKRGSVYISPNGEVMIDERNYLPESPRGDLIQAGPILIKSSLNMIKDNSVIEGFSSSSHQFDSDITKGRYPRSAIGINEESILCIVVDGRSIDDSGVTLEELADIMLMFGAIDCLNLDGGGSASLVSEGKLINKPRDLNGLLRCGRPIYNAITFTAATG